LVELSYNNILISKIMLVYKIFEFEGEFCEIFFWLFFMLIKIFSQFVHVKLEIGVMQQDV